jgi:hypothetical protein
MFCPNCRAEYREGFTVCADCETLLIAKPVLPAAEAPRASDESPNPDAPYAEDPFCKFWEGHDPRICADLCSVLDEAGIPQRTLRQEAHLFRFSPNSHMTIGVPFSLYEEAGQAVAEAFGGGHEAQRLLSASPLYDTEQIIRKFGKAQLSQGDAAEILAASAAGVNSRFGRWLAHIVKRSGSDNVTVKPRSLYGNEATMSDTHPEGSFVTLWAGEDDALHIDLLESLDDAGIPYSDKALGDDEVAPTADPLPIDFKPRFGFEVAVLSTDLDPAKTILETLLDREPVDRELPAEPLGPGPLAGLPAVADGPATQRVWSGSDEKQAQFIMSALAENQIPAHYDTTTMQFVILVAPGNDARAREIVREITEATPPA